MSLNRSHLLETLQVRVLMTSNLFRINFLSVTENFFLNGIEGSHSVHTGRFPIFLSFSYDLFLCYRKLKSMRQDYGSE